MGKCDGSRLGFTVHGAARCRRPPQSLPPKMPATEPKISKKKSSFVADNNQDGKTTRSEAKDAGLSVSGDLWSSSQLLFRLVAPLSAMRQRTSAIETRYGPSTPKYGTKFRGGVADKNSLLW